MITYFHRNTEAGYSINKVIQTIIRGFEDKQEYYVPYIGGSPFVLLKNIIYVRRRRNKKGINHITGDILYCALGLIGCKCVLTIHDTGTFNYQQGFFVKRLYHEWLWLRLPMMIATRIVCISEDTRQRLYKYTQRRDLVVIHNAVDPIFIKSPKVFAKNAPNILLIGTGKNKNLIRTFNALRGLKCHLTIIGKLQADQLRALEENKLEYTNKVDLNDEEIVHEYNNSDIVSFISLFEGFGMIVIEANLVGRPVICSNIDVLHEVGGNAALYVDPLNVDSMREGFERLIQDPSLRESLVDNGYINVKRFNVDYISQQWKILYEEINE